MKTEDFCGTLPPDMKEYDSPCPGKPLVSFLKGMDYSLNSLVGKKNYLWQNRFLYFGLLIGNLS